VKLTAYITAETKLFLYEFGGELSLGWAIDELVRNHKVLRNGVIAQSQLAPTGKIN
jgi:hypothetical protein